MLFHQTAKRRQTSMIAWHLPRWYYWAQTKNGPTNDAKGDADKRNAMHCIKWTRSSNSSLNQILSHPLRLHSFEWFLLTWGDIWAFQWGNVAFTLMSLLLAQRARIGHNFVQRKELTRIQQLPCYQTRTYPTANVWHSGKWLENSYDFKQERDEFWALIRFYLRTLPWI